MVIVMIVEKGSSKLRPLARIIKTIGDELISNDVVALVELIKNSYDADSKWVKIKFKNLYDSKSSEIIIKDDGVGMSLETVKRGWMEPASALKTKRKKSDKGRALLGEKGIGRFAASRLSKTLLMITKKEGENEVVAEFNWEDFNNEDKYLDEISCSWEVREPEKIQKQGTILFVKLLNRRWMEDNFKTLRTELSRLINPFSPIEDFRIFLSLPEEFKKYSGEITSSNTLAKPHYKIQGSVDSNGCLINTFYYSKQKGTEEKVDVTKLSLENNLEKPRCGPFDFEIRVWDRDPSLLKKLANEFGSTITDLRTDLDEAAGISLYRDSFRVLPYGKKDNDWLRLDSRRVNNPTLRLSNSQIVGYVGITLSNNPYLRDQSNREGIIDCEQFEHLKQLIKAILAQIENKRYKEKREYQNSSKLQNKGIFYNFTLEPVSEMISKKLPGDEEAKKVIEEASKQLDENVKRIQEVIARYRRISTLGLLLDAVIHDGNTHLLRLENQLLLLEIDLQKNTVDLEKAMERISFMKQEKEVMALLFKRLEPFGGRKRGHPKRIVLEEAIHNVFEIHKTGLENLNVKYKISDGETQVTIDEAEFEIIIVNLLQNSLYWLKTLTDIDRKICVEVSNDEDSLIVIFSDNGPGINEEDPEIIFDPYYSTKPDGTGLGLTIVGEILMAYDGSFELLKNGPLDGATFKLSFRRRIK